MVDEGLPGDGDRQDQLLEEASIWFARMRGPDAEHFRPDFDAWLVQSAAHRGAYNQAGEIFALGKFLAESDTAAAPVRPQPFPRFVWLVAATAALLLIVGIATYSGPLKLTADDAIRFAQNEPTGSSAKSFILTGTGERRSVPLPDGSTVTLEADSRLLVHYDDRRRALTLERGRARFEVAHERRSFIVFAQGGSVTARGTIFDVSIGTAGVTVRLLRGAVDVSRPAAAGAAGGSVAAAQVLVTRLTPGEMFSFGARSVPNLALTQAEVAGAQTSPDSPAALEFERTPLAQIIAETNRGAAMPIRLADPALGALQVSGRFRIDDNAQVADRLAALFDLRARNGPDGEILLERP